jgi:murein DD-endopeptidase MepM/ murein hydrolase activator NlpD
MAKITRLGQLGSTGVSSGPHLHAYIKNLTTGEYEDPGIHRSKFLNVRVGPNRVPKYIADEKGGLILNPAAGLTMTSGFGARNTGIPGASTYHRGRDYGGAEGTEIYVEGDVKFTPRPNSGGYGNLATWTTQDQKYELGYGHMKTLGEAADLTGSKASTPSSAVSSSATTDPKEFLVGYLLGTGFSGTPKESPQTAIKRQFVQQLIQPRDSSDMYMQMLASMPNPYAV